MARAVKMPAFLNQRDQYGVEDDFLWYISPHLWTSLAADVGVTAPAQSDAAGGVVSGATGVTDNNEIAVRTTNELFLVAANRPIVAECRLQYAEANVNAANVAFGLADALGADLLVDNGAGPKTSGNYVLIYKVDGETVWRASARNGTAVTTSQSATTAGGAAYQTLRVEVQDMSSTQVTVCYYVDNVILKDAVTGLPINHQLNIASSTEMRLGAYLKGGSTTSETLNVDYMGGWQVRN